MNDTTRTNKTHIETRFFLEAKFRNKILYFKSITRLWIALHVYEVGLVGFLQIGLSKSDYPNWDFNDDGRVWINWKIKIQSLS